MSFPVYPSGNLVADPVLRFSKDGNAVCDFRIAVSTGKDKPASFYDCVCFSYVAENLGTCLVKGDRIMVKGRIISEEWTDKDGGNHRKDKIIAEDIGPSLVFAEVNIVRKTKEAYTGDNKTGAAREDIGDLLENSDNPF